MHTSAASFEGMQANRMADGRTSKRRVDDAESFDAGKRHKSAGELRGRKIWIPEGYFDLGDEDAGVTFGAEVTAVLDGRCEVLLDYTGDRELIPTGLVRRWLQPDMKGLVSALGAMGAEERQPLGLLERRREGSRLDVAVAEQMDDDGPPPPPPPAPRRRSPARRCTAPVDVQPVAPLPELVNSRAFSLEA